MPTKRLFQDVAHNIAHHAASGLSYLYPHLGRACKSIGEHAVVFDLLAESPFADHIPVDEPLRLSSKALQQTFITMVLRTGFTPDELRSAKLYISFDPESDTSLLTVRTELELMNGKVFTKTVN